MNSAIDRLTETVQSLCAKIEAAIIDNNAEAAVRYAEALRDVCAALSDLFEARSDAE